MILEKELTDVEKEAVIYELAERIKDLVFVNAENRVRKIMDDMVFKEDSTPETEFEVTFRYRFSVADILQIVGRVRRHR